MHTSSRALGFSAFLVSFGIVAEAHATRLEACGGIYLDAEGALSCQVVPTESCTPKCELVAGEKVCAARLTTTCEGGCTASAELVCTTSCGETCVPECTAQTDQPPNCMGLCMSSCQQDCTATCEGAPNKGECRSSCAQVCSNDCHDQCDAQPATECAPVCVTACSGSCEAQANIDCQVSCQSESFTTCKTEVVEECKNECTTTGAAIFCEGQFLATGGDLQACADQLEVDFGVTLDVSVSVSCEGNTCEGEASVDSGASVGCAMAASPHSGRSVGAFGALSLLGLSGLLLRRSRRGRRV